MIMVPPMLNASSISADHIDVKVSLKPRVDMTAHDMSAKTPVKPRMEYLMDHTNHDAMRQAAGESVSQKQLLLLSVRSNEKPQTHTSGTYHQPAMSLRDDPPQRESASSAV